MMGLFFQHTKNVTRIAAPYGAVPRSTATLMQQRGWGRARFCSGWAGPYATRYGTWPGTIEKAGDTFRIFIQNPPADMQHHPKWPCFHKHDESGWWRIHLHTNPADGDPNAVIRYVEQILTECFKR
jgi:hypothetical protein